MRGTIDKRTSDATGVEEVALHLDRAEVRDLFASFALAGILAGADSLFVGGLPQTRGGMKALALDAYELADAMLGARSATKDKQVSRKEDADLK